MPCALLNRTIHVLVWTNTGQKLGEKVCMRLCDAHGKTGGVFVLTVDSNQTSKNYIKNRAHEEERQGVDRYE